MYNILLKSYVMLNVFNMKEKGFSKRGKII